MSIEIRNGLLVFLLPVVFIFGSAFVLESAEAEKVLSEKKHRKNIVKTAKKLIGTRYRAAGKNPKGFDCSGFSYYVMKKNNVKIGASSRNQALQGEPTKIKKLKPGDLIFFGTKKRINHVGIVSEIGRNTLKMIHASSSRGIVEEDVYKSTYWKKRIQMGRSVL